MAAAARTLRIGLIPGDGIGREVIPCGRRILEALPSSLGLKFSFVNLEAGFETFQKTGVALPEQTIDALKAECDGALFGAVRYVSVFLSTNQRLTNIAHQQSRPRATPPPSSLSANAYSSTPTYAQSSPSPVGKSR